jgi:hypothetical protein
VIAVEEREPETRNVAPAQEHSEEEDWGWGGRGKEERH